VIGFNFAFNLLPLASSSPSARKAEDKTFLHPGWALFVPQPY
jgi:hypothetical protein